MRNPARSLVSAGLVAAGIALFGHGIWIYAKARFAQVLLHRAWTRTLAGERQVPPWPWADTWPVARLTIPSAGTDFIVLAGASGRTLAWCGPGHLDGTARPGEIGNCVLSAHRDTQFASLRKLARGDRLVLETADRRRHAYRVSSTFVVDRRNTRLLSRGPRLLSLSSPATPSRPPRAVRCAG